MYDYKTDHFMKAGVYFSGLGHSFSQETMQKYATRLMNEMRFDTGKSKILDAIADRPEGISHADLSKVVGLHASTAFHLIRTMLALGYLRQDPETKRYHIARRVFLLAARVSDEVNLVNAALPVMRDLAEAMGETAHLGVLSREGVITIAKSEGTSTFRVFERLGVLRPAHCTAIGKAMLASLPKAELDDFLARIELQEFTPRTLVDPVRLRREIDRVCAAGYAVDDAEFNAAK